jgi:SAM-dependent methyltransferase
MPVVDKRPAARLVHSDRLIPPDRCFFQEYWFQPRRHRWPYQYQWFLRPCREHAFGLLHGVPPGPILQVGSGLGSVETEETDPSTHYLELFPQLLPPGRGIVGDAQMLPLCDASVAAIWTQTVSMHVSLPQLIGEAHRVLRTGGMLVLIEPLLGHPPLRLLRRVLPARRTRLAFPRLRDLEELTTLFSDGAVSPYFFFSPLLLTVPRIPRRIVGWFQTIDRRLVHAVPTFSRYAWYAVAVFRK